MSYENDCIVQLSSFCTNHSNAIDIDLNNYSKTNERVWHLNIMVSSYILQMHDFSGHLTRTIFS